MSIFVLLLQSGSQSEKIENIVSFIGEDQSGQFGICAHHARMMTCLKFGLAQYRYENNETEYLALPGGLLYFNQNQLVIATRHYLKSKDYQTIVDSLEEELQKEEENIYNVKESLYRLDEELLKRLWRLNQNRQYEI